MEPHRGDTAPGLGGPGSAPRVPASGAGVAESPAKTTPEPVDFDALSAALSPASRARARSVEPPHESHGRSSAAYASPRPHSVPPARVVREPVDTPAVIVASDATGPQHVASPPDAQPLASPRPSPQRAVHQRTVRMPDRPRLPRTPTIVLRRRGPSTAQKLVAFMAMLVLVTACGIAVIIWRKPAWLGLASPEAPARTAAHAPAAIPTTTTTALPSAPARAPEAAPSVVPAPSASAALVKKPKRTSQPAPPPQP